LLLAIGGLLIAGAVGYQRYWLARPIGSGPAGPAVERDAFSRSWSDRKVLLVGMGDSITAGLGAPQGRGYYDLLLTTPADDWPEMRHVSLGNVLPHLSHVNLARSGSTSIEHIEGQLPRLEAQDPGTFGVVVLTTGGNDLIHSYGRLPPREGAMYGATWNEAQAWIANFDGRLGKLLDGIEACFPGGCRIYVANIYDPTDGVGDAASAMLPDWPDGLRIHAAYNDILARQADERTNVELVDLHGAFLGHGTHCRQFWRSCYRADDPHYWYYINLEDPNVRGYDCIRRLFLIEMARTLPAALRANTPGTTTSNPNSTQARQHDD
jgi:lysophospholipase L1-like esterase